MVGQFAATNLSLNFTTILLDTICNISAQTVRIIIVF